MSDNLYDRVFAVLARVPEGRVVTYGQIARALGMPHGARAVGWAMRHCPEGLPWHRVVNGQGRTSLQAEGAALQRALLEAEGVVYALDGSIDLQRYGWDEV